MKLAPPKIPVPPLWEKVMVVLVQAMRLDQETIDLLQTIPLEKAAELCVAAHGDRNPSEHIRHAMSQVMLAAAEMDTDPVKDVYQALDSKAQQMLSQLPSDEAQRALQKASRAQCASAFVVGYARRYWKAQPGMEEVVEAGERGFAADGPHQRALAGPLSDDCGLLSGGGEKHRGSPSVAVAQDARI
ncbi:unnamed protein product [Effrenium voratum]|nr:unnamed protein product [Effrenium voratum]